MTTKVSSEKLKQAVNIANRFISLRPTLPVLGNLKLESTKTKLTISATNLENSLILQISASGNDWETTVPAKLLLEFINLVSDPEAVISFEKDRLEVSCGVTNGSFNTISAAEFPVIPEADSEKVSLSQKELFTAVSSINFAASVDEGKPVLNGILVRSKDKSLTLVATDSYRLAEYSLAQGLELTELVVPAKSFSEAVKIGGELGEEVIDLGVVTENNQLFFSGENFQVATRLIDGTYPNFEQIIPTNFVCEAVVDKASLVSAVKQTAVFARETGNVVKLFIDKKNIRVWASTKQIGEGESKVLAEVEGEELEIAFNSRFLLDGFEQVAGPSLKLKFSGNLKPALILGENDKNFRYVVMPVKSQN